MRQRPQCFRQLPKERSHYCVNDQQSKSKKRRWNRQGIDLIQSNYNFKEVSSFLANQGVIEEASSFQIAFSLIEGNDFANRYHNYKEDR